MNFSVGIIAIVGVLVAISIGFIAMNPDDVIQPRMVSVEEKPTPCTLDYTPVCGIDGETYGNLCMLKAADVKLDYSGECNIAKPEPVVEATPEPVAEPEPVVEVTPEPIAEPEKMPMAIVSIPAGAAVPGCEETLECYLPYEVSVSVGQTVTWSNDDSAAHTVTSGTPDAGLSGMFDSGLFMSGSTFPFTFDEAGTYDYFCMVHPWMTGIVNVN
ncbi:plastocyanin/azurin family copper-binding protein [Nitrosopumilus ureiphilus]|nr:plastocyanin/azurin family copper-binding protein [Nitrosopumilus ureiphilus]